jgi:tetratricopeptide (TPR) repeat protein
MTDTVSSLAPAAFGDDPTNRLDGLLKFLDRDPTNVALLTDAADAALAAKRPDMATELLASRATIEPAGLRERNLEGLAAMQDKRFADAASLFARLMDDGEEAPGLKFNFAWSAAMAKDFEPALVALDDATVLALPQAAMLKVQLLHGAGRYDEASDAARSAIERHPDDAGLAAAVSVLAIDMEDTDLAAFCAARGGDHPDALTTRGTLALDEFDATAARELFDHALSVNPHVPRAWIGRGLSKMMTGEGTDAAADLDRGAEMFGDHLGSWIAAGWAHFVAGDRVAARARFETALAIDPNFAECQGSLAVVDILDGRVAEGRERASVAMRLDRESASTALAMALLATGDGNAERARRIFETALTTPIDDSGRTIAQSMARMGMS